MFWELKKALPNVPKSSCVGAVADAQYITQHFCKAFFMELEMPQALFTFVVWDPSHFMDLAAEKFITEPYLKKKKLLHKSFSLPNSTHTWKQTFINNKYSNCMFDRILQSYLSRIHNSSPPPPINDTEQTHTVYYRNQFSTENWWKHRNAFSATLSLPTPNVLTLQTLLN